ncbi:IS3 family transposase [Priestia megaterium]|uniref:IS3 family transposase n=1 Tax=Priestia megaterium TaxID=1404 RepID=UPI003A80D662
MRKHSKADASKREIYLSLTYNTTTIVEQTVKNYITYYNIARIQATLNNQSPVQYRQLVV